MLQLKIQFQEKFFFGITNIHNFLINHHTPPNQKTVNFKNLNNYLFQMEKVRPED